MPESPDPKPAPPPEEGKAPAPGTPPVAAAVATAAGGVKDLLIEDELKQSYLTYAMSVIVSRALPDARDGCKPSQRRVLVAMRDLNLSPRAHFRKCAKICGDTSGNYHPHGEAVVYPTLVRLAQPFNLRYPLIEGQGNFGSIDGDPPAAMRYTEARLSQVAMDMMEDLDKDAVDYAPNYDETREEPVVLPGKFPNLICNGGSGIAVGMATNLPPHNIREVCDALVALVEKPDVSVEELMRHIPGPDFPTHGLICGKAGIRKAYLTGRGHITVRAKLHVENLRGDKEQIVVTEIPYQVIKERLIEKIVECVKAERIQGIADVNDESDREGMRLVIELKRGEESAVVINQLFKNTPLQETFAICNLALVQGQPRTLNLKEMLEVFRDHRVEVIERRTRWLLAKAEARLHILEGLIIALDAIDEIISIIRAAADTPAARAALRARFRFSDKQADAILEMKLSRLTGLSREEVRQEYEGVRDQIREYKAILADRNLVLDIFREDLFELRERYGDDRRTEIISDVGEFEIEDLVAEEMVAVTVSHAGYVKREPLDSYRSQRRGGKGVIGQDLKEGDFTERLFIASTHDYLLFFTDQGRCHWVKVYDLPQLGRAARGRSLANLLSLAQGEKMSSVVPVRTFEDGKYLFMATAAGTAKKVELAAFSNPRKGGIIAIDLAEGDKLVGVELTGGQDQLVLATLEGQAVRFNEEDVRAMGRGAAGVRGAKLDEKDRVVALVLAAPNSMILTICEKGYGKRSPVEDYRLIRRGGSGVININTSERNGPVVACMAVAEEDEIMVTTAAGQVVRSPVKDIRITGRNAQGVRVMTLEGTDRITSVAHLPRESETDEKPTVATTVAPIAPAAGAPAAPAKPGTTVAAKPAAPPTPEEAAEEDRIQKEIEKRLEEEEKHRSGRLKPQDGQ
jgi:DNA gyrase subunit A